VVTRVETVAVGRIFITKRPSQARRSAANCDVGGGIASVQIAAEAQKGHTVRLRPRYIEQVLLGIFGRGGFGIGVRILHHHNSIANPANDYIATLHATGNGNAQADPA
jgi:hypothetical protein